MRVRFWVDGKRRDNTWPDDAIMKVIRNGVAIGRLLAREIRVGDEWWDGEIVPITKIEFIETRQAVQQ